MMSALRGLATRTWLWLILAAYLLLAVGYGIANPLFEAPDEHWHFFTALYVAENKALPAVDQENPDEWMRQEAAQPPLYYLLGALLVGEIDTAAVKAQIWENPRVQWGDASARANRNNIVHGPQEAWPWRGYVRAAHLLRLMSTLFGLGTLLGIYGCGRQVWGNRPFPALLATAMVAFLPQFAFIHSTISNDALITLATTAALWQLLRLWQDRVGRNRLLLLGITVGLAILSKTAGLLLLIYAVGVLFLLALRDEGMGIKGGRRFLKMALLVAAPALLVGGWLLWRNWLLYGDVTATSQFIWFARGDRQYTLGQVAREVPGLWASLFAIFGWFNVRAPQWVYWLWNGIVLLAVAGALWGMRGGTNGRFPRSFALLRQSWMTAVLLLGWFLAVCAGLLQFLLKTTAAQGRLLFPATVPLALGLAYGLSRWRWRPLRLLVPGLALLTTLYCLLFVIPAAYALPPVIAADEIPPTAVSYNAPLGQGIHLAAAQIHTTAATPGNWVEMTLYWRATGELVYQSREAVPQMVVELYGRELALVGKLQSYHGSGLYPATYWQPDTIIVDRVAVRLQEETTVPTQVTLVVKLADETAAQTIGFVKAYPAQWGPLSQEILAQIGDSIQLAAATVDKTAVAPGEMVTLRLRWQVQSPPGRELATFVHLRETAAAGPIAQGDSVPLGGDYPTRLWEAGEVIEDQYQVRIPAKTAPGRYPLMIGMYEAESVANLPLRVEGTRQPGDAYLVAWIEVQ